MPIKNAYIIVEYVDKTCQLMNLIGISLTAKVILNYTNVVNVAGNSQGTGTLAATHMRSPVNLKLKRRNKKFGIS